MGTLPEEVEEVEEVEEQEVTVALAPRGKALWCSNSQSF
jgi:hypothetical protein